MIVIIIWFYSMGASQSKITETVSQEISQAILQSATAKAVTNCNIKFGSIDYQYSKGCNPKFVNICTADANTTLNIVIDSTIMALGKLTQDQRSEFLGGINISSTDTNWQSALRQKLQSTCNVFAGSDNNIIIDKLSYEYCENSNPVFTNTGHANVSCAIDQVLKAAAKADQTIASKQSAAGPLSAFGDMFRANPALSIVCVVAFCTILVVAAVAGYIYISVDTGGMVGGSKVVYRLQLQ